MNPAPAHRRYWVLWRIALALFFGVWLFPLSTGFTRLSGAVLFCGLWLGLIGLCWRRRAMRLPLLGMTVLIAGFLALPGRRQPDAEALRRDYVEALRRYDGVTYSWGGESPRGIDCSGLIRRGLIDALFLRGLRTLDPGLVRRAIALWWRDTTAKVLGQAEAGLTLPLFDTPSLNQLDHSTILPGDLAVTDPGVHVMAYLGNQLWIEADPGAGRVITVRTPAPNNVWFIGPMKIVRWEALTQGAVPGGRP